MVPKGLTFLCLRVMQIEALLLYKLFFSGVDFQS
jgi:hypothetical protein